jgi:shikimate dehydrogenase
MVRGWTNCRGFVVTVPYKQTVAPKLDRLTARAARFGTVNVVRRDADGSLEGEMLDGVGFIAAAGKHGVSVRGKTAIVVGAGGVASAIANSLCEEGVARLRIQDLDTSKQDRLIATLRAAFPSVDVAAGMTPIGETDVLVNGTPVGMNGDPHLPLPPAYLDGLTARTFVADVVTSPAMTPFLTLARARGCTIQVGTEMTETQIEALAAFMRIG